MLPTAPYPQTTINNSGDNMVVKLEDHEQPPSKNTITEPFVTLIEWKYMDIIGNQHSAASCSTCHRMTKSYSEGRQLCRYFDLLLGVNYGKQSCPRRKRKPKQKPTESTLVEELENDKVPSKPVELQSTVSKVEENSVKNKENEVSAEAHSSVSEDLTISNSDPNFVEVSDVSQSKDTSSFNEQSSVIVNEKEQTSIISDSVIVISPSLSSNVVDEQIISPQYSSTLSSIDQSTVSLSDTDQTTYYPLPGEVVIPTPSQTELADESADSVSMETGGEHREPVSSSEQINDKSIELEPSYKSPSVIDSEDTLNKDSLSSATTTPELPPLTDDSVVAIDQQAGKNGRETDLKHNGQINENSVNQGHTEPPPEVSTEPIPVQATAVDESLTGSKEDLVIPAANTTDNGAANEPKKDLNLVRVPVSPLMKRESAMMRLNNRLKALEVNVSLSSRFLEELSKRYRKQSDEVMKLLNKTISKLNHTSKMVEEKDEENREMIGILEARIDNLTSVVTQLVDSVGSLDQKLSERNLTWVILEVVIVGLLMIMSWRRNQNQYITPEIQKLLKKMPSGPGPPTPRRRRNSSTGTVGHSAPQLNLFKHSSESALDVQADFHIIEPLSSVSSDIKPEGNKKKKKKKQKNLEINQEQISKETPPTFTSSTNQQYSCTSVGGATGPGEEGVRLIDSCPSFKPRSNSHSGPIRTFHSDSWINSCRKKLGSDTTCSSSAGSDSSTSLNGLKTLNEPYIVDTKPPLRYTQSAKRLPPAHTFPPPPPKISKSLSQKSLAHSNINRNAILKKQTSEPWHHRAQSDGSVKFDTTTDTFKTGTACGSGSAGNKQRNRDSYISRSLDHGQNQQQQRQQRYILSKTPENLHATNGNTTTTTADSIGSLSQQANQPNTGRKWSLGLKFISIK